MSPEVLRSYCNLLNPAGQTKLAKALGWSDRTMRLKIAGKSPIKRSDAMAVMHYLRCVMGFKL